MPVYPLILSAFEQPVEQARPGCVPCFFMAGDQPLHAVLRQPYSWFLENGDIELIQSQLFLLLSKKPFFAIDLSTSTAYDQSAALQVAEALHRRAGLQRTQSLPLHTCIHEALSNAIIHGNLELESRFDSMMGYECFQQKIAERLADPAFGSRRITIAAWLQENSIRIAVRDQGAGFLLPSFSNESKLPHGRGLEVIQETAHKLWVGEDSRTLWIEL